MDDYMTLWKRKTEIERDIAKLEAELHNITCKMGQIGAEQQQRLCNQSNNMDFISQIMA